MISKLKYKLAGVAGVISGVIATGSYAFADTFGTSTAPTLVNSLVGDVAVIIGAVVGAILGLLAALLGLGWGIRKFKHYITGRKF
jgi:hypothetical protein